MSNETRDEKDGPSPSLTLNVKRVRTHVRGGADGRTTIFSVVRSDGGDEPISSTSVGAGGGFTSTRF